MTSFVRETHETRIEIDLARGTGGATVETGQRFLDHMLVTLARYSRLDLRLAARGDLKHHLIEDSAIALGAAVAALAGEGIARYGDRTLPMDDALVHVSLDVGGRPYYRGGLPSALYEHWMRSFADHARATLHVRVLRGRDRHHVVEAAFKALGLALRDALLEDATAGSTKGTVRWGAGGC